MGTSSVSMVINGGKYTRHVDSLVLTRGKGAAVLYSLVQTCKAIDVDPKTYLCDVLERIAKESDVEKPTPHGWKEHLAATVAAERDRVLAAAVAAN